MKKIFTNEQLAEIDRVADFFETVEEREGIINMNCGRITQQRFKNTSLPFRAKNLCGMAACVGGWLSYYYEISSPYNDNYECGIADYTEGAYLFAKKLGFANFIELEGWLRDNSKVWGAESCRIFQSIVRGGNAAWSEGKEIYSAYDEVPVSAIATKLRAFKTRIIEAGLVETRQAL